VLACVERDVLRSSAPCTFRDGPCFSTADVDLLWTRGRLGAPSERLCAAGGVSERCAAVFFVWAPRIVCGFER